MIEMLAKHTVSDSLTIRETLVALNCLSGDAMTLFAVDDAGRLTGSVTDGDIRRALIAGHSTDDLARDIAFRRYTSLAADASPRERYSTVAEARRRKINLLPVLSADGVLTDIVDLRKIKAAIPVDAVLMAGGRGERLRPLTLQTPKPLLEVGGKPIIDYNVESLLRHGVRRVYVTVNYLKEQIIRHFDDPRWEGRVVCIEEPRRLGTMGSVALIDDLVSEQVIVMNSDLLTNIDFERLWRHHVDAEAALTIATVPYTVSVPFAILRTDGDRVTGLEEKPTFNHFANAGVYISERRALEGIAKGEYLDAPDFVESLIAGGRKVSHFAIEGTWIDIGSPDDFRYANEIMRTIEF